MERVQDNKQSSLVFEQLFKQHYRTLCFHAMSLVNDLDASKDIVHDVFLSLWYHRASIDFTRPIFPYLFSLTRNRAFELQDIKSRIITCVNTLPTTRLTRYRMIPPGKNCWNAFWPASNSSPNVARK